MANVDVVKDYKAKGDGSSDSGQITAALAAAVSDVLKASPPRGGGTVHFPTPSKGYGIDHPLVIPSGVNVRLVGPASHGATLFKLPDSTDANFPRLVVISGDTGEGTIIFERLNFMGGAVCFVGPQKGRVIFRDCAFFGYPRWAVVSGDYAGSQSAAVGYQDDQFSFEAVRHVSFERCSFSESGDVIGTAKASNVDGSAAVPLVRIGTIWMGPGSSDWRIRHCGFNNLRGTSLLIEGRGCVVADSDFTVKWSIGQASSQGAASDKHPAQPYFFPSIQVTPKCPGGVRLVDLRFGNEHNPPLDTIVLGPLGTPDGTSPVRDVVMARCTFRGVTLSPQDRYNTEATFATQIEAQGGLHGIVARSAVRASAPTQGVRLVDCIAHNYRYLYYDHLAETAKSIALAAAAPLSTSRANALAWCRLAFPADPVGIQVPFGLRGFDVFGTTARGLMGLGTSHDELTPAYLSALRGFVEGQPQLTPGDTGVWGGKSILVSAAGAGPMPNEWGFSLRALAMSPSASAYAFQSVPPLSTTATSGTLPVVFSVFLKSPTIASVQAEIEVRSQVTSKTVGGTRSAVRRCALIPFWQLFWVALDSVPFTAEVTVTIRLPQPATASVVAAMPSLSCGEVVAPPIGVADVASNAPYVSLPLQVLRLGGRIQVGAGAMPASAGAGADAPGDRVWNDGFTGAEGSHYAWVRSTGLWLRARS